MLKQMLIRIQNTTFDLDRIEVLVNIDDDDDSSLNSGFLFSPKA